MYEAIDVQYIISIGSYSTCTFNTEILAALEVFKNRLFYHILKDCLISPVSLRYIHTFLAKTKILDAPVLFSE